VIENTVVGIVVIDIGHHSARTDIVYDGGLRSALIPKTFTVPFHKILGTSYGNLFTVRQDESWEHVCQMAERVGVLKFYFF